MTYYKLLIESIPYILDKDNYAGGGSIKEDIDRIVDLYQDPKPLSSSIQMYDAATEPSKSMSLREFGESKHRRFTKRNKRRKKK